MKKPTTLLLAILIGGCMLCACSSSKTATINDLRTLSEQIATNGADYTVNDWKKTAQKFAKIQKKLTKYEYNASETEEIGELTGKCMSSFATSVISNVGGKVVNAAGFIKGLLNGATNIFSGQE